MISYSGVFPPIAAPVVLGCLLIVAVSLMSKRTGASPRWSELWSAQLAASPFDTGRANVSLQRRGKSGNLEPRCFVLLEPKRGYCEV